MIGPLMVDIDGYSLSDDDVKLLQMPSVGGVILFSRNFHSPDQLHELVSDIKALRSPPLLVAVDQEGGRVQRFREGFSRLPAMRVFGQLYDQQPERAIHLAHECGWLMAAEIRSTGIDISFAPVLDLDKGISTVIGTRAFHHDPIIVGHLAKAFVEGMAEAGMPATGKHFPGHGSIAADSHTDIPVDSRSWQEIEKEDLLAFQLMIDSKIHALMMAHVIYSQIDPLPAGFSRFWVKQVLREKMGFKGVIFSDDLSMQGAVVVGDYRQRAIKSIEAGCDMVLVCNHRVAAWDVANVLKDRIRADVSTRLSCLYGQAETITTMSKDERLQSKRWQEISQTLVKYADDPGMD